MHKSISFKVELSGEVSEPAKEKLLFLVKVMRTIAKDLEVKIEFPAVIHLDDLDVEETKKSPQGGLPSEARRGSL